MIVLVLSPYASILREPILEAGDVFVEDNGPLVAEQLTSINPEWVVSYGNKWIIPKPILELLPDRFINLHISLLPFNRGTHPNFWSFAENTPAGVSIHLIDEGIDTGDILYQQEINFTLDETLSTSYESLRRTVEELFARYWKVIRRGEVAHYKQLSVGTFHKSKDIEPYMGLLTDGWDTPVGKIAGIAKFKEKAKDFNTQ